MKKHIILTFIGLAAILTATAQEYKISKTGGKMVLNLPSAIIEGYSGNEIVFKSERKKADEDPRAVGLRAINGSGYTDNTGLGISVTDKGTTVEVREVASNVDIKILVPKGVIVSFAYHKVENAGKVSFRNLENEIEVAVDYNSVELENVTGPLSVSSIYGAVDAKFGDRVKGPISIASIYSTVDVAIPVTTNANVKLDSSHGSILASADLKIVMEKKGNDDMISYGNLVVGKLGTGGTDFKLTSEYGKIYLRKTK